MKLTFTGDINFRGFDGITAATSADILSEVMPLLASADYRIVNLETPLADKAIHAPIVKSGPNHMYDPACISFLETAGADVAVLANNHLGDYGDGALLDTLALLTAHGIGHIGAGRNLTEAYQGLRLTRAGMTVSLLAVCEHEFGLADEQRCGVAAYMPRRLLRRIREEKAACDFVIVIFHGGNEFNPLPSPGAVERYRMICDMGADALIAMHTHCPQGYEIYEGKPIVYSMGNFMFQSGSPRQAQDSWYYGYLSQLEITKGAPISLTVTPYKFDTTAHIKVFEGTEKAAMCDYLTRISDLLKNPEELRLHYMGWCALHQYFLTPPNQYGGLRGKLAGQVNMLTCQAYLEMLRENYRLLNDGEEDIAKAYTDKIAALSAMPV